MGGYAARPANSLRGRRPSIPRAASHCEVVTAAGLAASAAKQVGGEQQPEAMHEERAPVVAPRPPYTLTGLLRPHWRGRKMGWLHTTGTWYAAAAAYVLLAWKLPSPVPLTASEVGLRAVVALASCANIWISDGYHNGDRRGGDAYSPETELFWLRLDYVGISSVLTSLLWLWSSNFGWVGRLRATAVAGGAATALIALLSGTTVPQKAGCAPPPARRTSALSLTATRPAPERAVAESAPFARARRGGGDRLLRAAARCPLRARRHLAVKLIMAMQFVGLLGYLCWFAVLSAPAACLWNTIVFWVYAPGLILYVLKKPQCQTFGFHEYFHSSVIAGHVVSMALDLRNVMLPCARGFCSL